MKIVINVGPGGFSLSNMAVRWLQERDHEMALDETPARAGLLKDCNLRNIPRNDPLLIECVKALGSKANGRFATLKIVEVDDSKPWRVSEYDGWETVDGPEIFDDKGVNLL